VLAGVDFGTERTTFDLIWTSIPIEDQAGFLDFFLAATGGTVGRLCVEVSAAGLTARWRGGWRGLQEIVAGWAFDSLQGDSTREIRSKKEAAGGQNTLRATLLTAPFVIIRPFLPALGQDRYNCTGT